MSTEREVRCTDRHRQIVAVLDEWEVRPRSNAPQQAVRECPTKGDPFGTGEQLDRAALTHERLDDQRAPWRHAAIHAKRVEERRHLPAQSDASDAVTMNDL